MTTNDILRAERRDVRRYTWRLLFDWQASRAERARWKALRAYHRAQIERLVQR